jgi:hypothetical protein
VGAPAIWWFVDEVLSGQTHDPVKVFRDTRNAYAAGTDPVLCISQNSDFSGAPHCLLPVGWDDTGYPWQILLHDPNFPSLSMGDPGPRPLKVYPDTNSYTYDGGQNKYSGTEWSGGRLHYMPFSLLCERPRTPVYEALMLLMTGLLLILGSDSETVSLTDDNGVDLDAYGADSIARLKVGQRLTNKFVSVKGFDQERRCTEEHPTPRPRQPIIGRIPRPHGVLTSELHMRGERAYSAKRRAGTDWTRLTLKEYLCQVAPSAVREKFARYADFVATNRGRLIYRMQDSGVIKEILGAVATPPKGPYPAVTSNFVHTTRGLRSGKFQYGVKQGLTQFELGAETVAGERLVTHVKDLGTHTTTVSVKGDRDKRFSLLVNNRLGVGNDHLSIKIKNVPLAAGGELAINMKPGIGGIELVSAGQKISATAEIEYSRGETQLAGTFELGEQTGIRIVPSTLITSNQLKVIRIDTLFGESLRSSFVKAKV